MILLIGVVISIIATIAAP
ncbi:hypothetical protein [Streptomyces sp. Tu 2975]|nr:hypothetical protein [Streptomyces sp. Tu 2975]